MYFKNHGHLCFLMKLRQRQFSFLFVRYGDSLDWMEKGVEAEINQVLNHKHLQNGSILLFHNDAKYTPQALGPILEGLQAKGFEIVPISELIYRNNYEMNHEGRQVPLEEEAGVAVQ